MEDMIFLKSFSENLGGVRENCDLGVTLDYDHKICFKVNSMIWRSMLKKKITDQ
jgi:hypothetical protein